MKPVKLIHQVIYLFVTLSAIGLYFSYANAPKTQADVPKEWLACEQNSDCRAVPAVDDSCACACSDSQVNQASLNAYLQMRSHSCTGSTSTTACNMICPDVQPRCVAKKCGG